MSNGMPSMTALLGLLAVAGYQHREKISEMLGGAGASGGPAGQVGGLGNLLGGLSGGGSGGFLNSGLGELLNRFKQGGQGEIADSWVGTGANQPVTHTQLHQVIGPDVLATLAKQTGLAPDEILKRLSTELPNAVDKYTPDGRFPS